MCNCIIRINTENLGDILLLLNNNIIIDNNKNLRATGSSGSTAGFLGPNPSSSSSDSSSSSSEGTGDSAILYWGQKINL